MALVLIDLMISMQLLEELQHNYYPTEETPNEIFFYLCQAFLHMTLSSVQKKLAVHFLNV